MGVHSRDIIFDDIRIFGERDQCRVALQALADPGGVVISASVHDELRECVEATFDDLGERELTNIVRPIPAFALRFADHQRVAANHRARGATCSRRSSVQLRLRGKADVRQIGRELSVRYVIEGSVRRSGDRMRITGQLVETENGRHVWAEKYDGATWNIFDLQDRITESVAGAIEPQFAIGKIRRNSASVTK